MRKDKNMKNALLTMIFAALIMGMTACSGSGSAVTDSSSQNVSDSSAADSTGDEADESVQIPNPWVAYENVSEMSAAVGFEVKAPDSADGLPVDYCQAMDGLAEVDYSDGSRSIIVRKGKGTEDLSGDFNTYKEEGTLTVAGQSLTTKGGDGIINLAVWTDGEYTYSINSSDGLSAEAVKAIAEAMI